MSKRKPYNDMAGYVCSRRNEVNRNWVVICDAAEQGLDTDGGRWVVLCIEHGTLVNVTSVKLGRPLLKIPDFCEECMEGYTPAERAAPCSECGALPSAPAIIQRLVIAAEHALSSAHHMIRETSGSGTPEGCRKNLAWMRQASALENAITKAKGTP